MKGYPTSYVGMFQEPNAELPPLRMIEIPIIQRDYAQGRDTPAVEVIRNDFLDVLVEAIGGGTPVNLDFVYGEIDGGTLRPLDGQQRLTTLFLLHWYVAARLRRLDEAQAWLKLRYATRPTAELFCRELVKPANASSDAFTSQTPQEWIKDQPWYLYAWRHDPTVTSMLNMLDAIHHRLGKSGVNLTAAWDALTTASGDPAIGFYFLPIDNMRSGEELYIKMNSRGKTLTSWENLKPRLERLMASCLSEDEFGEFVRRIDGVWTDVLWKLEADDGDWRIDEEFERYLEFIVEVSEWRDRSASEGTLLERAERVFTTSPTAPRNVRFLSHAFDTWTAAVGETRAEPIDTAGVFEAHFAPVGDAGTAIGERVLLFEESRDVNLFKQCCRLYGLRSGRNRRFTLAETLVLLAVLLDRQAPKADVQRRLRILRNLTDTAGNEVIEARMADLVEGVERLMSDGAIDEALEWMEGRPTFNPDRLADERHKLGLIPTDATAAATDEALASTIFMLEDHPLLRGRIFPFGLEPDDLAHLPKRAATFAATFGADFWPLLTAALLAVGEGDYGYRNGNFCQLGTVDARYEATWRDVLTRYGRKANAGLRASLAELLDAVAGQESDPVNALQGIIDNFLHAKESTHDYDWRYYLVRYPVMRSAPRGMYQGEHLDSTAQWRYSMCLMTTPSGGFWGSATYKDPFLLAIREMSAVPDEVLEPSFNLGSAAAPRWMRTMRTEAGVRCVPSGFELEAPQDPERLDLFDAFCQEHGVVDGLLSVEQTKRNGELIDAVDRVQVGARLVRALVDAGF